MDSPRSRACRAGRAGARHGEPRLKQPPEEPRRAVPRRRWGRPAAEEPTSPRPLTMPSSRPFCRKRRPMDEVGSGAGLAAERLPPPRLPAALWGGGVGGAPLCLDWERFNFLSRQPLHPRHPPPRPVAALKPARPRCPRAAPGAAPWRRWESLSSAGRT